MFFLKMSMKIHDYFNKATAIISGVLIFLSSLTFAQSGNGLYGEYFNGRHFNQLVMTRHDADLNFGWFDATPHPKMEPGNYSIRWKGQITTPQTGKYLFRAVVDDGIRLWVNGQRIINAWGMNDTQPFSGYVTLEAGKSYDIIVEYFNGLYEGEIQLRWQLPSDPPAWGGLFGYNDQPIDRRYFSNSIPLPQAAPAQPIVQPQPVQPTPKPKPARPVAAIPKKAKPIAADTLEKYLPKNILFEKGKTIILSASMADLDNLANFLRRNPTYRLRIEGHTDNVGDSAKNLVLSQDRAKAVANYLITKGIASGRMTTQGFGDTRPLYKNSAGQGDERNRRVEFFIA